MVQDAGQEIAEAGELLSRIARGETRALESFYDAYHARVYSFALKRLSNSADATEILNEVMLEVWRSASRFEGRSRPLTWVLGIAHHKVIDRLRRRRHASHDELDLDLTPDESPGVVETMAGTQDAARVRHCVEQLPESQRLMIQLAFFDDLSYPEISEIANVPVGTVKTRVFHAKQALKRCLGSMMAGK
jgi:RNA polymerase sigma-70 factor (ECF subfamily)